MNQSIFSNPTSAAISSFLLALPMGLIYITFMFDIEQVTRPLTALLSVDGNLTILGRIVVFGGLLLLPVAFVLNMRPFLKREEPEGKRRLPALNLIVGTVILLLLIFTWGGLILEEIYCLQGIRCD